MEHRILKKFGTSLLFVLPMGLGMPSWAQCSFTVSAPDVYYCGNSIVTVSASASPSSGVSFRWALSEEGELLHTPSDEVSGITYTSTNAGASLNIDGLTSSHTVWVRGTKTGCSVWQPVQVIYAPPNVDAGADQTVCLGAGAVTLTGATPSGGTWSGPGVLSNAFTPSSSFIASPPTLTYRYTNSYGCMDSDTLIVSVEGIGNPSQLEVCKTTGAVLLNTYSGIATGSWSGDNVVSNAYLPLAAPEYGTINFSYTTLAHGCTGTVSQVVHAYNHTAIAGPSISNPGGYVCGGGIFTLAATGFGPGQYLWYDENHSPFFQSNGQLYSSNSYTTPNLTSSKTFYVQGIDGNDCGTQLVEVTALVAANPPDPTMISGSNCSNGEAVISVSSPNSSYNYEWTDINGIAIHTNSSETIGFTLTNAASTLQIRDIPGTGDFGVRVRAVSSDHPNCHSGYTSAYAIYRIPPTVSIGTSIPSETCTSASAFTLSGATPAGGTWKVNNGAASSFDPHSLGAGSHTVLYNYTDQYGCSNSASGQVTVHSLSPPAAETFRTVHGTTANLQPVNPGANKTFNWYTASSGGSPYTTADTWTTGNVTTTLTYYISLKDELISACESESRASITVYPNYLPVVDAGLDKDLTVPQRSTTLTATYSDPDGTISSVHWQKVSGPDISLGDVGLSTLSLTDLPTGNYVFRLTAFDNYSYENHDDVLVTVAYPPNNYNFVTTEIIQVNGIVNHVTIEDLDEDEKIKSVEYIDGLGRPFQQIQWRGSAGGNDVVQPVVYDEFGRERIRYLPYVNIASNAFHKSDAISEQFLFYNEANDIVARDTMPYAETIFESSPLNRVVEQGAPGKAWQPDTDHTVKKEYLFNAASEILNFSYNSSTGDISLAASPPNSNAYFAANKLTCTRTIDEEQNDVLEYVDTQGRTICKKVKAVDNVYASTYYVYDDLGNLVVVLPPEAVRHFLNEN